MGRKINLAELQKLSEMQARGIITDKEFEEQKFIALNGRRPITAKRIALGLAVAWFVACVFAVAVKQLGGGL